MSWEQIFGFLIVFLRPEITMALWTEAGLPFWQTFLYTGVITSLTTALTYYLLTDWMKKMVKKILDRSSNAREIIQKISLWYKESALNLTDNEYHRKFGFWLIRQKNWIILAFAFVPAPSIPTIVTVTARFLKIKGALPVLLAGNIFRTALLCASIYGIINPLF